MTWLEPYHVSRRHRNELLGFLSIVFTAAIMSAYLPDNIYWLNDLGRMVTVIEGFGTLAPVMMMVFQFTQVVIAPIPGQIFGVAGGYLFGTFWATVYGIIGMTAGSYIAILLGRFYGRPLVERFVSDTTLDRFDGMAERHGTLPFFTIFLLPGLPDDAVCYLAGMTTISARKLVFLNLIGRIPALVAFGMAGDSLANRQHDMFLTLLVIVGVTSVIAVAERNRIIDLA